MGGWGGPNAENVFLGEAPGLFVNIRSNLIFILLILANGEAGGKPI